MILLNPKYLLFLIFAPIYIYIIWQKRKNKEAIQISVFEDLREARGFSYSKYLEAAKHILAVFIIIFFAIALARPQSSHERKDLSKSGIDIIIVLDVSESMLAEDLEPNRIEAAKESIEAFLENIKDDRLGIVVFSGQPFTQSPLTFDHNILKEYLERISTKSINQNVRGLGGTAIGDAILSAVNRFKKSEDRSKVLILLTDGDANTGVDPVIAAKKAQAENIKLYAVGIGKEGGAPLPTTDMFGRKNYARNRDGSMYMATFNEEALKKIADAGDGKYFRAGDNNSFNKALEEINSLEKREIKISATTEYTENFQIFLNILCFLFFIYILLLAVRPVVR